MPKGAWQCLSSESDCTFPNQRILQFIMILPLSTVEWEKGFSHLNLIKTDTRTHLLKATVNDLMFLRLYESALSEFNPNFAIDM